MKRFVRYSLLLAAFLATMELIVWQSTDTRKREWSSNGHEYYLVIKDNNGVAVESFSFTSEGKVKLHWFEDRLYRCHLVEIDPDTGIEVRHQIYGSSETFER